MKDRRANSTLHWAGRSWRLRVYRETHEGSVLERGVIEHPGSVVIVPMRGDEVLFISQYRLALDRTILELPAGTREHDEEPLDCARRELREETGFRASDWQELGKIWPAPGVTDELMTIFYAGELSWDPLPADIDEEIELRPFRLEAAMAMTNDGRIQDAKSIIGISRALDYLSQK